MKLSEESELSEFSQLRTQLPDLDNDDCTTSCDELAVNVQPSPEGHQCECHAEKEEKAPELLIRGGAQASEPQKMLHTFKKMDAINPTCAIELRCQQDSTGRRLLNPGRDLGFTPCIT